MLQGQADRQTFAFRINAFALINVKQSEVFQHWPSLVADALQQVAGDNGLLHHHGDIPSASSERRESREARATPLADPRPPQLEEDDRAIEVQLAHQLRVQGTEPANQRGIPEDAGALTGMQGGMFSRLEAEAVQRTAL